MCAHEKEISHVDKTELSQQKCRIPLKKKKPLLRPESFPAAIGQAVASEGGRCDGNKQRGGKHRVQLAVLCYGICAHWLVVALRFTVFFSLVTLNFLSIHMIFFFFAFHKLLYP